MLPTEILYRGETKEVRFTLKSGGLPLNFADLSEVTVLVLVNKQLVGKYRKTGGTGWGDVEAVAGTGNENKCTVLLDAADTSYYWLGELAFELSFPAGVEVEVENAPVFFVKDSETSRI